MKKRSLHSAQQHSERLHKIMSRIRFEEQVRVFKRNLMLWSVVLCSTFAVVIPVYAHFQADMNSSGFNQFLALFTSDWDSVSQYWQDLLYSLVESFPLVSGILFFGLMSLFLWSIRAVLMNSYRIVRQAHLLHHHKI